MIARNPCDAVDAPRPRPAEMTTWTAEQAQAFLEATADDPHAALWRLALLTGMRRGELLALRWQDIDIDRAVLGVRRTLTRDRDGHWTYGEAKSAAGKRSLSLPPSCVAALKRHKASQSARRLHWGDAWQESGHVFDRGDGAPLPQSTSDHQFRRLLDRLTLPRIRFHDLRHTAATLMLEEGVHPRVAQQRLGHSNVGVTLKRYSHVAPSMERDAADRLEARLSRRVTTA